MVSVLLLKLNGWPETFDERVAVLAARVDEIMVIRPKPTETKSDFGDLNNVKVFNLYPPRGSFIKLQILKPIVFPMHVFQSIILMSVFLLVGRLPPVIHTLDYALGGTAGAVVHRLFSIPLVISVRGLKEPQYESLADRKETVRSIISYRILRLLTKFSLTSADYIITKADYQVTYITNEFNVHAKFTTVPTGVRFDVFDPGETADMENIPDKLKNKFKENNTVILYLSKIIPRKRPDKVLHLIKVTEDELPPDINFAFVGAFRDKSFELRFRELRREVEERTFLYPNSVGFNIVPWLLNKADAVILLSDPRTEGVPRILQESCAMQTPIIGSNVVGIANAFEDLPGCYLINRSKPQEFKWAVKQATGNPPEMPRDVFAERFDIHRNYAKYAAIYDELSKSHH